MKRCSKCGLDKLVSEFSRDKNEKSGYTAQCRECRNAVARKNYDKDKARLKRIRDSEKRKEYYQSERGVLSSRKAHLKRTFGITVEQYDELSEAQLHVCAICGKKEDSVRNKVLSVDHCHKTGKIRGLLCNTCNRALGLFKENVFLLKSAIDYITKYNKQ